MAYDNILQAINEDDLDALLGDSEFLPKLEIKNPEKEGDFNYIPQAVIIASKQNKNSTSKILKYFMEQHQDICEDIDSIVNIMHAATFITNPALILEITNIRPHLALVPNKQGVFAINYALRLPNGSEALEHLFEYIMQLSDAQEFLVRKVEDTSALDVMLGRGHMGLIKKYAPFFNEIISGEYSPIVSKALGLTDDDIEFADEEYIKPFGPEENTAIHFAAFANNTTFVDRAHNILGDSFVDAICAPNKSTLTSAHIAAFMDSAEFMQEAIVREDSLLNRIDELTTTASLQWTFSKGTMFSSIKCVFPENTDLDAKSTIWHIAAHKGSSNFFRTILAMKVQDKIVELMTFIDSMGNLPIGCLIDGGHFDLFQEIVGLVGHEQSKELFNKESKRLPLHSAISLSNTEDGQQALQTILNSIPNDELEKVCFWYKLNPVSSSKWKG